MGKLASNVVDVSIVSKLCQVNGVRSSFVPSVNFVDSKNIFELQNKR